MAIQTYGKLFDLHFEIGLNPTGDFYAKTILGSNSLKMEESGLSPAMAIDKLAKNMENNNFWAVIVANPSISSYPLVTAPKARPPVPALIPVPKPDPNVPKKKPMDLTQTEYPNCQILCTSFDHFGAKKCKSMCRQRNNIK